MALKPPQSSIDNFNDCWDYYGVSDDEVVFEKTRIMANFDQADLCYSIIAAGIRAIQVK